MTNGRFFDEQATYQIRVLGNLEPKWSDWFDGFTMSTQEHGETLLIGSVDDQATLHGVLAKLGELGLPILLVARLEGDALH